MIVARLEDAGRVLLALPHRGPSLGVRTGHPDVVHDAAEAYGYGEVSARAAPPSSARITRMDETLAWLALIPGDQVRLRRVVGLRCLVHPVKDRHLWSWRKIAREMGIDHHTAVRWHAQGIACIEVGLRAHSFLGFI